MLSTNTLCEKKRDIEEFSANQKGFIMTAYPIKGSHFLPEDPQKQLSFAKTIQPFLTGTAPVYRDPRIEPPSANNLRGKRFIA